VIWQDLERTNVLLGISGGIAAYKSAELCRMLVQSGATVRVMMTKAALKFVGEITFAALTDHGVATDLFDPAQESQIGHIQLADRADLLILAPATADLIAKMSCGIADDLVTTVYLACTCPVLVAPAMNVHMWEHPATQQNVNRLRQRGHQIVGPESGDLACGYVGAGRMAEPHTVMEAAVASLATQDLAGRSVLVTAGPTHEPLDPVRFLGNRSSGRMGFAVAAVAAARGALVKLVTGPTDLRTPYRVERVDVTTALQMAEAVYSDIERTDAVIMAAAVADYRPRTTSDSKLKKDDLGDSITLELTRNEDILATLGGRSPRPYLVGFAAETGGEIDRLARDKLAAKGCDLLVANDVSATDAGFEVETNRVTLYDAAGGKEALPLMHKREVAQQIIDRVAEAIGPRT
jgi:phosphopantothenoylcysteine decarboxylase/phosphopantothenate--cysteine ligase